MGRAFYSKENTLTPAICGTAATILFLPLYYYAAIDYGVQGIAALSVFGVAFYAGLIAFVWAKKHGKAGNESAAAQQPAERSLRKLTVPHAAPPETTAESSRSRTRRRNTRLAPVFTARSTRPAAKREL